MCRARHGGPRTASTTNDTNVGCAFVENALVFIVPKIGWARAPLAPLNDSPNVKYPRIHLLRILI